VGNKEKYREPQFVMVNGVLIREKNLKYLEHHKSGHGKDKLVKKLNSNKNLYTSVERLSM